MKNVIVILLVFTLSCRTSVEEPKLIPDGTFHMFSRNLDAWLEKSAGNKQIPSAAVRVIHGDRVVYEKLVNTNPHKTYGIASITKTFTATAIMQLIQEGKIHLDDPVTRFFPDFDISTEGINSKPVTIRNLLNHTSGIPDLRYYKNPDYTEVKTGRQTFRIPRQIYPAGLHYRYSNHGFILLGGIVEKVSGLGVEEYYYQNIFQPLEMKDVETEILTGASGIKVSIDDFTQYAIMWLNSGTYKNIQFLRKDFVNLMYEDALRSGRLAGLGWRVEDGEMLTFFHIGGADRIAAWIQIFPKMNVAVVYLADPPEINNSAMYFIATLQKKLQKFSKVIGDPVLKPVVPLLEEPDFTFAEGEYENPATKEIVSIKAEENRLFVKGKESDALYFDSGRTFRSVKDALTYEFYPGEDGIATSFTNATGYFVKMR